MSTIYAIFTVFSYLTIGFFWSRWHWKRWTKGLSEESKQYIGRGDMLYFGILMWPITIPISFLVERVVEREHNWLKKLYP